MNEGALAVVCVLADDDVRERTTDALAAAGVEVRSCDSLGTVEATVDDAIDCVITGAELPDGTGFDVVDAVREALPDCPVVLYADAEPHELPTDRTDQVVEYLPRSVPNATERLVSLVGEMTMGGYQVAYPVPADESARLEALRAYDVADRGAVEAFERMTELVASHFDIDVAFVGLVDRHEERFVACEGANWQTLSREDTICTHTILEEEVMVVEDVTEDPRFANNDRLGELGIRSYAGARLATPEGHALGALCCTHGEPRSYTDEERTDLRLFAEEAMEQLELRRRLNEPSARGALDG